VGFLGGCTQKNPLGVFGCLPGCLNPEHNVNTLSNKLSSKQCPQDQNNCTPCATAANMLLWRNRELCGVSSWKVKLLKC